VVVVAAVVWAVVVVLVDMSQEHSQLQVTLLIQSQLVVVVQVVFMVQLARDLQELQVLLQEHLLQQLQPTVVEVVVMAIT
jgi:hypothetical protein